MPELAQIQFGPTGGFRRHLALALSAVLLSFGAAKVLPANEKAPEARLERPSWGKVTGWVVDAYSRKPIPGARVAVEVDGAFPETGRATDLTEKDGQFQAKAPLGKISKRFDWGRLLTMHPISLVFGPSAVTKKTKVIDVSQVNVRVEAYGYRPFVGRVRATLVNAADFQITLDDVWLAPTNTALASFSPENLRLEVIESLTVDPPIAAPGEKVRVTLACRLPVHRGFRYRAFLTSSAIRLVEDQQELKAEKQPKDSPEPDRVVFTKELRLPKRSLDTSTEIGFFLVRNDTTALRQRDTRVLLQTPDPEGRPAAEAVLQAFGAFRRGDRQGALASYQSVRKQWPEYSLAHRLYAELCLQLNRPADAAGAYAVLAKNEPGGVKSDLEGVGGRYAWSLLEAGRVDDALTQLADLDKQTAKSVRVPEIAALTRARIAARKGDFEEADKWLGRVSSTGGTVPDAVITEINLARMATAVRTKPSDPELRLSYARVLSGARRREEAVGQIREAAKLDPRQPWAFLDLGTELWETGRRDEAISQFRHAVKLEPANVEARLALADALRQERRYAEALPLYKGAAEDQKLNLRARHFHALMLYANGQEQSARTELLEVLAQARDKGDLQDDGFAGIYFGPKRRNVAGFSIPEAVADAELLEALQDLDRHPENGLLWQNIGSALSDLGLPDLAVTALQRSLKADPTLLETRYFLGTAYRKFGDGDAAEREQRTLLAANPLHPRARLELAQIYTDRGELERAQSELLTHRKNYPYQRAPRPTQSFTN